MKSNSDETPRLLRELFEARVPISEIVERSGLTLEAVVRLLNAPRVARHRGAEVDGNPIPVA